MLFQKYLREKNTKKSPAESSFRVMYVDEMFIEVPDSKKLPLHLKISGCSHASIHKLLNYLEYA